MSGEDVLLWANVAYTVVAAIVTVLNIRAFRRRPKAPPPSPMIRWSVFCTVTAVVALLTFMFWLGTRHPG